MNRKITALVLLVTISVLLVSIPDARADNTSGSPTHLSQTPAAQVGQSAQILTNEPFGTTFDPKHEGFTQEVFGAYNAFFGGVAFSHHGDPIVNTCQFSNSLLVKFLNSSSFVVHGTTVHTPVPNIPSPAGCGMTNNPDGFIYSNTSTGVRKFNDNGTEFPIAGHLGGVGVAGNALGIAVQPKTGAIFYVTSTNNIQRLNVTTGISTPFVTVGGFVDQIVFDGTGKFLYLGERIGFSVKVVDTTIPAVVQSIPLPTEPDGMAIHIPTNTLFVITTAGTIERVYLSNSTTSTFASGGFRGDNSEVGPDGCLYLSQEGTRYLDGTVTGENSVVRVCPNFVTPPGVNHPPVANDDKATTHVNTPVTINVLANDTDPDNDPLKVTSHTTPSNGAAVINSNFTITYTPNTAFIGSDSFKYTISDGHGGTASATVRVNVTNVNHPPIARDDKATTIVNTPVTINVLANDTDPDGDLLTVTSHTTPSNGAAVINHPDFTITYTPNTAFIGSDSFKYTISDGHGGTASATVRVTVKSASPISAGDDSAKTIKNIPVIVHVLDNDTSGVTIKSFTSGIKGKVSDPLPGGTLVFSPNYNVIGTGSFHYTITDGVNTASAKVTVKILNIPHCFLHTGNSDLTGCDYTNAYLPDVDLGGVNLKGAIFKGAYLYNAHLGGDNLQNVNFGNANLTGADLGGSLVGAIFKGADLHNVMLGGDDLHGVNFTNVNLSGSDLGGANLVGTIFEGSNLHAANLGGDNMHNDNLKHVDLTNANLSGANLSGANLTGANLTGANIAGTDFTGAIKTGCIGCP